MPALIVQSYGCAVCQAAIGGTVGGRQLQSHEVVLAGEERGDDGGRNRWRVPRKDCHVSTASLDQACKAGLTVFGRERKHQVQKALPWI